MHYYIITGASRGLGKALAEAILRQPGTTVVGVSRHATIDHPRYQHQPLDLSDIAAVENNLHKVFPRWTDAASITLVNNAAVVGEIGYVGEQTNEHYNFVFDINLVAPAMLMNTFLSAYSGLSVPRAVLNISSGAAQRPVDGWAAYCASKAALEALTATAHKEQQLRGSNVRIHSLSPGVIDTSMQEHIRAADPSSFSESARFHALHAQNSLNAAEHVAGQIMQWLQRKDQPAEPVLLRLADIA
ncbi:SDR family NAD(P)-dependent oxidoreductase [Hymenobacter aquaticus]|uniref:SDR family NAD(P)-dependent oxidoreductase n=1 Tax=Hymenobacter aquaticus TaxID=1867101 RepID=A0A4Z0PWX1_9BACT|nr:SDR family NAD(P)-dependent oxidoreductase [Hymenobacter aquaticus]TGE22278.1 SDR family NAD(P)-dependent oxidoreductase [Hymenobacter aquaticus]